MTRRKSYSAPMPREELAMLVVCTFFLMMEKCLRDFVQSASFKRILTEGSRSQGLYPSIFFSHE